MNYIVCKTIMYKPQNAGTGIPKVDEATFDTEFLLGYGLRSSGGKIKGEVEMFLEMFRVDDDCYYLFALRGESSGHGLAAYRHGGIAFFDPNYGEAVVPMSQFAPWYDGFWEITGYRTKYTSKKLQAFLK
jgi:hypothetical protein